jgi:DNA/RNA endonuclease YhcR with UshA esterase domain
VKFIATSNVIAILEFRATDTALVDGERVVITGFGCAYNGEMEVAISSKTIYKW